jgi:hypothetical protein
MSHSKGQTTKTVKISVGSSIGSKCGKKAKSRADGPSSGAAAAPGTRFGESRDGGEGSLDRDATDGDSRVAEARAYASLKNTVYNGLSAIPVGTSFFSMSPVLQSIVVLMVLLFLHALLTMGLLLMSALTILVVKNYFYATKSFHVFLPFTGAYFAGLAVQKVIFDLNKRVNFLDVRMFWAMIFAGGLLVVDLVFFGLDEAQTLIDCYTDAIPPISCTTSEMRAAYTAHVALNIIQIFVELVIMPALLWVRLSSEDKHLQDDLERRLR